ncbi:hypothetical protein A5634_08785 [Mycobacterium asiaticum]|uniref:Secreted protein n=1 Tax=Mycobacterium asiaticum TaxID=1790 RepID=A0A1A3NJB0_MYCAS|nr:hypothetical protein [Mycobacterium asiaticum]OBK21896.1 hypothetical protein A5634_08785 [Mycobacterium asiaticum]
MRSISAAVCAAAAAVGLVGAVGMAPAARAYDPSVNGTFTATMVGDWARTRTVYHDEDVVRSTWTITSSCATAQDCSGKVVSDQGWSAPMVMHDGLNWYVKREIPNWEVCADGTSFVGHEVFYFYPANPETGDNVLGSPVFAGREHTTGPSGACGTNAPLYIEQPFRLDRIS